MNGRSALLVVDVQPDFLPGGTLPVAGGDEILEPIARLVASREFAVIVATQDWHPPDHVSFASRHPGKRPFDRIELHGHEQVLWPDHCIQGTVGASLAPGIPWDRATAIIRKATDPGIDSYSAFRNNWDPDGRRPPTGLTGYLKDRAITDVYVCGLARDFCVKWSAEDAVEAGFRAHLHWDLSRSIDRAGDAVLEASLGARGVEILK
jgi:nicotinamidase/pyrazinamidase